MSLYLKILDITKLETFRQLFCFFTIGVINTGIHLAVVIGIVNIVKANPVLANCIAFLCANLFSFFANTRFTFKIAASVHIYSKFFTVSLIGLAVNATSSYIALIVGVHYIFGVFGAFIAMPIITFMSHKIWVFKKGEDAADEYIYLKGILCNLFIIVFAFAIYSSIRYSFWRADDADHLYAATIKGLQLLYKPEAWQIISKVNFTPLNTLVYGLFYSSHTLNPQYLYELELLLAVVFGVVMSNAFIRFGLHWMPSLMAASACLISEPTYIVFSNLMTLHYAFGATFALVSAVFFMRNDVKSLLIGSIFCFLAFLFKDVFGLVFLVPYLRLVLNAGMGFNFNKWPSLLIPLYPSVIFFLWRRYMINSSVGGYNGGRANLLDALFSIKMGFNSLYGNNILPILCIVLCVFLSLKKYGLKISLLIGVFLLIRHVPEPVHASNTTLEYGI